LGYKNNKEKSEEKMSEKTIEKGGSSFNKILANPQYIHIFVEVIAITGVIIYFSRSLKTLNNKIDILAHKVEEQQAIINRYEDVISKLIEFTQKTNSEINSMKIELNDAKRNQTLNRGNGNGNRPINIPIQKPLQKHLGKPGGRPTEKFGGKPTETPIEKPTERLSEKEKKKVRFENIETEKSKIHVKKHADHIDHLTEPLASVLPAIFAYQFGTSIPRKECGTDNTQVEELDSEEENNVNTDSEMENEDIEPIDEEIDFDEELKAELEEFK
jgi:hypothetical protein